MRTYKGPIFAHRHYAEIAKCIAETDDRETLIAAIIRLFQSDNHRFQRERFEAAARGAPSHGKDKR